MKTEFEFIQSIRNKFSAVRNRQSAVRVGIGDDCAVIPKNAKTDLLITTDLLVEDVDFCFDWTTPEFLGHKSLAVSLSDIAAMGAKPVWALLSIGIPEKIWRTDFVEKFYHGWFELAEKFGVELAGGDVSRAPDKIVIDSIVAGEAKKGKAILRSTAKVGDLIFVTGILGGAAVGLKLLENGERFKKSKYRNFLRRQLAPNPQIEIGQILGARKLATAMIDLSDGLSGDLAHLCRESGVGARIFADKIPCEIFAPEDSRAARIKFKIQNSKLSDALNFALNGGEDFELLFTASPKKRFQLKKALRDFSFSCIGQIVPDAGRIELISKSETTILESKGFQHF